MKCLSLVSLVCTTFCSVSMGQSLVDYFLPMEPQAELVQDGIWGGDNVLPRDIKNGIEDAHENAWSYWDGKVLKDDEGKFHIYCSRWSQSFGHAGWLKSKAVHAVSDNIMGPYEPTGLIWPDRGEGLGHNITALRLHDGRYAVASSSVTRGEVFVSESPYGPFEYLGDFETDANGFNPGYARNKRSGRMSNVRVIKGQAKDEYIMTTRATAPLRSTTGILGPYVVMAERVYVKYKGELPQGQNEDPTIWYSGGMYHLVYNNWKQDISYHYTSTDGYSDWTYQGVAFKKDAEIFRYTDGTVNQWVKIERPSAIVVEDGHVTHFLFSVVDTEKKYDQPDDIHSSKVVVVPFDGVAFDRDLKMKLGR